MKKLFLLPLLLLTCGLIVPPSSFAAEPYEVGSKVEAFTLKDQDGNEHDLGKLFGKKVIVLSFWSCQCPVSIAYEERLMAVAKKYKEKDVVVFAIDSNTINDLERIQKYAKEKKLPYPVLKDWDNVYADRFDAKTTPEIFVIGKDQIVKYHGAIDNNQNVEKVTEHWLTDALDQHLAGKEIAKPKTKSFGCGIKRVQK